MRPLINLILFFIFHLFILSPSFGQNSQTKESQSHFLKNFNLEMQSLGYTLSSQTFTSNRSSLSGSGPQANSYSPSTQGVFEAKAKVNNQVDLAISLTSLKTDYESVLIYDKSGLSHSLSNDFDQAEHKGSIQASFFKGPHNFLLGTQKSLSPSPFSSQGFSANYYFRGLYDLNKIGIDYSINKIQQPLNYFTDRDFKTRKTRSQELTPQTISLWYEKVLTENLKTRFELLHGQRPEDRPDHNGFDLKLAYVLTPNLFLKSGFGYIEENTSTELKDDRGRFSDKYIDAEIIYSVSYKFQMKAAYGLNIESESDVFNGPNTVTGYDIYTIGGQYRFTGFLVSSNISLQQSNTGINEYNFSGGVTWDLF